MHPQLDAIDQDLAAATARLHALWDAVPAIRRTERPAPDAWSVAECVAHLNLTNRAMLPEVRDALSASRAGGGRAPRRLRRNFIGWLLWKGLGGRFRVQTTPAFTPGPIDDADAVFDAFEALQTEIATVLREADGVPLEGKVTSPFNPRVSYNVYAALTIMAVHEHRHLGQAERAWETISAGK